MLIRAVGSKEENMNECCKEIDRLSSFILKNYPEEIGRGNFSGGESAVDVAIRLLKKLQVHEAFKEFEKK